MSKISLAPPPPPSPAPAPKKSQYVPQIAPIISSTFLTFLHDILKNTLNHRSKKPQKSKKYSVLESQFEEN